MSSCLGISVQCRGFHNRLECRVEECDLYSVLNVISIKNGDFFSIYATAVVKSTVFVLSVLKLAVNRGINVILFPNLSVTLRLYLAYLVSDFKLCGIELNCHG